MANNFPNLRPTLNLDMIGGIYVDPRITFTRAGTRTYFGRDVVKAEENLLLRSQEFDNASWLKNNSSSVSNLLTFSANGSTSLISQLFTTSFFQAGATQTLSLTINATTASHLYLSATSWSTSQYAIAEFSISGTPAMSRTFVAGSWSIVGTTAVELPDGKKRLTITFTVGTAGAGAVHRVIIGFSDGAGSVISDGRINYTTGQGETIQLVNSQLEQRSAATAYTPTTTQPITRYQRQLKAAAANEWPREFDPVTGECLGRSVWESRTNLLLRSEEFDNASWTKTDSTVTANQIIAPDGTLTADKIFVNNSVTEGRATQSVTVSAGAHTLSVIAKAAEWSWIRVGWAGGGSSFNLANGTVGTAGSGNTPSIVSLGNGWYRCIVTRTLSAGSDTFRIYPTNADNAFTTGDGTSGIYIWGAQLEAGAFATPYIPTVASQVTRLADSAVMTGANFSSWYRQDEGAVYAEFIPMVPNASAETQVFWELTDNTVNNRTRINRAAAGGVGTLAVNSGGASQVSIGSGIYTQGSASKAAASYKINDFGISNNGGAVSTTSTGVVPLVDRFVIGRVSHSNSNYGNCYYRRITYYPQALTAANHQAITR